ncbi:hypothetical protein [Novosphingobium panipatense]|uniref:Uncharacterized protein n=1 Tax=Novosphingobium soli TaxID=574956 RepID=A0ABV6D219_9SPHN
MIIAPFPAREETGVVSAEANFRDSIRAGDDPRQHLSIGIDEDNLPFGKAQPVFSDEHIYSRGLRI